MRAVTPDIRATCCIDQLTYRPPLILGGLNGKSCRSEKVKSATAARSTVERFLRPTRDGSVSFPRNKFDQILSQLGGQVCLGVTLRSMLTAADPVTWQPQRIAIAGVTGAGKSTLAKRLSSRLNIFHVEIESLFHGPNWEPRRDFVRDVETVISGDSWVIEWQYLAVRAKILDRADTLIWLDLPAPLTLYQLTRRTFRRRLRKVELWNGNYEGPLHGLFTDSDHILRWGIRTRNKLRGRIPTVAALHPGMRTVRLASRRDIELWVNHVTAHPTP